jgi:hypothetical protein
MKFIQCSMCRRAAAWVIDKEVFCEGHKELIIETFGVDHFPIHRLTNEDDAFAVGGRLPKDEALFAKIGRLQQEFLGNCNLQLWFPDDASEENLYSNKDLHGIAFTDIKLQDGPSMFLTRIADECNQFPQFGKLSWLRTAGGRSLSPLVGISVYPSHLS